MNMNSMPAINKEITSCPLNSKDVISISPAGGQNVIHL